MKALKQIENETYVSSDNKIPSLEEVEFHLSCDSAIQPNTRANPTQQKKFDMEFVFDIPEFIWGIPHENFHKFISKKNKYIFHLIFRFTRILIDVNVAKESYNHLLDVRGKMPFGLMLESIDENVFITDTKSIPN